MVRLISTIEIIIGSALVLCASVLYANSRYCWFGKPACGMWESLFAFFALAIAFPALIAGAVHRQQTALAATLAYLQIALVALLLIGQANGWW